MRCAHARVFRITTSARVWPGLALRFNPHPTARIPTNPGMAPRIASKNSRNLAG